MNNDYIVKEGWWERVDGGQQPFPFRPHSLAVGLVIDCFLSFQLHPYTGRDSRALLQNRSKPGQNSVD
jgi:hypothetical protein